MNANERAAKIAELEGLVAELERQMAEPAPPRLRQEQEQGLDFATRMLVALREDDDEDLAFNADEVRKRAPRALRSVAAFERASAHVQVVRTVEPWQVWIRWDTVPADLREDVTSLASLWRDIIAGRALGRPPKKN